MATRRDQAQSWRFLGQRVVSALVIRDPDPEQPPFRRPLAAAFASLAITVLLLAGVGVYGLLVPGGNRSWRDGDAVIVVKETGARYVFVDGRLHPVLNYASALLALERHAPTRTVSRRSLLDVPRGPRLGIPDAPDTLPGPEAVLADGWSLCSRPPDAGIPAGRSVLLVGAPARDGQPLDDRALLVEVPATGERQLIWRGHRHAVAEPETVTAGLALGVEPWTAADAEVVDQIPAGTPIGPIPVAKAGRPSTAVPGRSDLRAGQLVVASTSGGDSQHFLVTADALRPITELQYDIQLAYPRTTAAYGGTEPVGIALGPALASRARLAPAADPGPGAPPASRPEFAAPGRGPAGVCVTFRGGEFVPEVRIDVRLPAVDPFGDTGGRTAAGLPLADEVHVRPGHAALVLALPNPQATTGALVLVTDQGRGHPLSGPGVPAMLGYERAVPVRLPAGLVARVPMGAGLDPVTARAVDPPVGAAGG
ncbi:type VII secretion protein EccB [Solwaraspora sp. WMMD1047]|uniref:type VII secretion protein EccB n=1 Tax=Solwaraspora sp. WMMD1047 TaxID=3016102 RepID=UPI002416DEBD|nr:type VII secretion protein EccB [Solwaraspora sp. WMMD1047]MDG4831853.1 type VII secretion protein EccB [Solwaraspora sp. WMMD1047]